MNQELLRIQCEMFALTAELEAMKAANTERLSRGDGLAYDESSFSYIASRFNELAQAASQG